MNEDKFIYKPIGVIRSEHTRPEETPIQPVYAQECTGAVEIFAEYIPGLQDIESFSHVYLIYHFHAAGPARLKVKPFLQDIERGVFATRAACRPNPVGISIVELLGCEGGILRVKGLDVLDGTPILDIKPYTARFDRLENVRSGWQETLDDDVSIQRGKRGYRPKK